MKRFVSSLLIVCFLMMNLYVFPLGVKADEAAPEFVAEQVASTNIPRGVAMPVELGGKIYFVGGVVDVKRGETQLAKYNINSAALESYDPMTNTWQVLTSMKYARSGAEVLNINNKIYVIGGYINNVTEVFSRKIEVYDPITDVWTELADCPVSMTNQRAAVLDNKIYCFGTRYYAGDHSVKSYVYDISTNTWSAIKNTPNNLLARVFTAQGKIYVPLRDKRLYEYEPQTDNYILKGTFDFDNYVYTRDNGEVVVQKGQEYRIFDPNTITTTLFATESPTNQSTIIGHTTNVLVAIGDVLYTITGSRSFYDNASDYTTYSNVYAKTLQPIKSAVENYLYILLGIGETVDLSIFTLPDGMRYTDIQTWTSGNTGIAGVDNTGIVTGVSEGVTTITVQTPDGWTDFAHVKVIDREDVNQTKHLAIDLPVGAKVMLVVADSIGENEQSGLTWTSSNNSVVNVSNGEVNAVSAGYTTIKVENPDGTWEAVIMVRVY